MVMFFIREKIDLNYTIIVKELKQELKLKRVELPQPPLKTNLERTIYDTCHKLCPEQSLQLISTYQIQQ